MPRVAPYQFEWPPDPKSARYALIAMSGSLSAVLASGARPTRCHAISTGATAGSRGMSFGLRSHSNLHVRPADSRDSPSMTNTKTYRTRFPNLLRQVGEYINAPIRRLRLLTSDELPVTFR